MQDTQSAELLPQLRDRLAESDRNLRVVRAREARVQERCAHVQEERQNIQTELDETRVNGNNNSNKQRGTACDRVHGIGNLSDRFSNYYCLGRFCIIIPEWGCFFTCLDIEKSPEPPSI